MPSITEEHLHSHIQRRMEHQGIKEEEVRQTLREGWDAPDAKPGTEGRTLVFPYDADWEGVHYEEKEGIVYVKFKGERLVLLTAIARYGIDFSPR